MRIEVSRLSHRFNSLLTPVLDCLDFTIASGEFIAVVGPSGCGKSTLLRIMAGLLQPTSGDIQLDGQSPLAVRKTRKIAWMAQSPALLPWLTAYENIALASRFLPYGESPHLTPEEALQRVHLTTFHSHYPFSFSGGMQQRLALARLLILNAPLWLMDEPFAALDEITRGRLTLELVDLWQPLKPTVLWVTHHIHEALRLADRIILLSISPGRISADIPVNLPRPRNEAGSEFQELIFLIRRHLEEVMCDEKSNQ